MKFPCPLRATLAAAFTCLLGLAAYHSLKNRHSPARKIGGRTRDARGQCDPDVNRQSVALPTEKEPAQTHVGGRDSSAEEAPSKSVRPNYVLPPVVVLDIALMAWASLLAVNAAHKESAFGVILLAGSVFLFTPELAVELGSRAEERYQDAWERFNEKRPRILETVDWVLRNAARVAGAVLLLSAAALGFDFASLVMVNLPSVQGSIAFAVPFLMVGSLLLLLAVGSIYLWRLGLGGKKGAPYVTVTIERFTSDVKGDRRTVPLASVLFIAGTVLSFIGACVR